VSNLIDQLARAKHLRRERSDVDLRAVRLYLTRSGERVVKTAPQPARGVLPDALESLKAKQLQQLDAQLAELLQAMKVRAPGASKTHLEDI
jgi:DNA-binding MarR family transcriptional regulator